jgi:hypothetical protein
LPFRYPKTRFLALLGSPHGATAVIFWEKTVWLGYEGLCLGVLGVFSGVLGSDFAKTRGFFSD